MPEWISRKKDEIIKRYGDALSFATAFNPSIQVKCALNIERTLKGDAPTIRQLIFTYPIEQVQVWLAAQMEHLNEFTGVKEKMSVAQMDMLGEIFITKGMYLKASEILLFFYMFRSGDLGELYGSVDPLKVAAAINPFLAWRAKELDKIEQKQRAEKRIEQREQSFANGITRARYLRNKFHRMGLKHNIKRKAK